ncbi:hypothetical protein Pelo_11400 [Pelomyxa schiedti]|nr:hypothetical protein Pelo_11400 [Pelomyxa schiedti]
MRSTTEGGSFDTRNVAMLRHPPRAVLLPGRRYRALERFFILQKRHPHSVTRDALQHLPVLLHSREHLLTHLVVYVPLLVLCAEALLPEASLLCRRGTYTTRQEIPNCQQKKKTKNATVVTTPVILEGDLIPKGEF